MNGTWFPEDEPDPVTITLAGWLRFIFRFAAMAILAFSGLIFLLLVRLFERPLFGLHRPLTPHITQMVCKGALLIIGMRLTVTGAQMVQKGAVVANHGSWLDIIALNAPKRVYFVAKSEVAGWPVVGWLARATGTVFITRRSRDAKNHQSVFEGRLNVGHKLLFFPEGTSTDGLRVLPFKSTLFQAFFAQSLRDILYIQPVTLKYTAPAEAEARYYGWWGEMELAPHFLKVLSTRHQGRVEVIYHSPVAVADFADRKALAKYCEGVVRGGMIGVKP